MICGALSIAVALCFLPSALFGQTVSPSPAPVVSTPVFDRLSSAALMQRVLGAESRRARISAEAELVAAAQAGAANAVPGARAAINLSDETVRELNRRHPLVDGGVSISLDELKGLLDEVGPSLARSFYRSHRLDAVGNLRVEFYSSYHQTNYVMTIPKQTTFSVSVYSTFDRDLADFGNGAPYLSIRAEAARSGPWSSFHIGVDLEDRSLALLSDREATRASFVSVTAPNTIYSIDLAPRSRDPLFERPAGQPYFWRLARELGIESRVQALLAEPRFVRVGQAPLR